MWTNPSFTICVIGCLKSPCTFANALAVAPALPGCFPLIQADPFETQEKTCHIQILVRQLAAAFRNGTCNLQQLWRRSGARHLKRIAPRTPSLLNQHVR